MQPSYIGDITETIYDIATGVSATGVRVIAVSRTSTKNGNGIVVYHSADGKAWSTNFFYNVGIIYGIAYLEASNTIVGCAVTGGANITIYRSTDLGATWETKTVAHGVPLPPNQFTQLVADNVRNRILIGSPGVISSASIRNLVLQSFDAGDTWSAAVSTTMNNTRATMSSLKAGSKPIVVRLFPSTTGGENSVAYSNVTDNTFVTVPQAVGTPGPAVPNNRAWTGTYNPNNDTYAFNGTNIIQEFSSDFTTYTDRPLGFNLLSGESIGNIVFYNPSNELILCTYNTTFTINQANTRIFKAKDNFGWVLDPTPLYNASAVQYGPNGMFMDNTSGVIQGYIQGSVTRGAGIGYLGTASNMPTPTPSATATLTATPKNTTNEVRGYGRLGLVNGVANTGYTLVTNDGTQTLSVNLNLPTSDFVIGSHHVTGTNELIIYGQYSSINGVVPTVSINRIDRNGTVNPTWSVTGIPVARNISSMIKVSDDEYYFGINNGRVHKMNGDGVVDTAWGTTLGTFTTPSIIIDRLNSNKMYVGSGTRIVKVDIPTGTIDTTFPTVAVNNTVTLAQQSDGKLLVGGQFTTIGGTNKSYYARISTEGVVDPTFTIGSSTGTGINVPLNVISVLPDDSFYITGSFTQIDGLPLRYVARIKANGRADATFDPVVNSTVFAVSPMKDGRVLLAGTFTNVGGTAHAYVARVNYDGTVDDTFTGSVTTNTPFGIDEYDYPLLSLTPTVTPSVTPTHTPVPSAIYTDPLAFRKATIIT